MSSSDSGSLVIDTLASGGDKEPPVWQRVYWAILEGFVAAVLLLAGGLEALQTMTIASAFPMLILIVIAIFAFLQALKEDYLLLSSIQDPTLAAPQMSVDGNWKEQLTSVVTHPTHAQAKIFLKDIVGKGLLKFKNELVQHKYDIDIDRSQTDVIRLVVRNKGVENFAYGVRLCPFLLPDYVPGREESYYRAEVFLSQGGQNYDLYGYTEEQVIADAITHFKKHLHFLHLNHSERPEDE